MSDEILVNIEAVEELEQRLAPTHAPVPGFVSPPPEALTGNSGLDGLAAAEPPNVPHCIIGAKILTSKFGA